ncbi:MAG: hypothetical protein QXG32_04295 [Candidatus Bathyarchaeia archaeon]
MEVANKPISKGEADSDRARRGAVIAIISIVNCAEKLRKNSGRRLDPPYPI